MKKLISKLILYRNISNDNIIVNIASIFENVEKGDYDKESLSNLFFDEINKIITLCNGFGFSGNLWQCYITYLLAMSENPFTLSIERCTDTNTSLNNIACLDIKLLKQLFDYKFKNIEHLLKIDYLYLLDNFKCVSNTNTLVFNKINELYTNLKNSKNDDEFYNAITSYYKTYGVGMFGLYKAFRVTSDKEKGKLVPIVGTSNVRFDDIIGYEEQKEELIKNTNAFINNKPANNVLLYGDAGTGKSTSIKSLLNQYYDKGLRMIEVYKQDFKYLSEIISDIRNRNYRFIIYMDDLSFEIKELDYKYLKAIIEGDLEEKPTNVLIYATSNRRHLIHETFSDRKEVESDDVHIFDTMSEQMSLANRFGITIGYFKPKRDEYFDMIYKLADKHKEINIAKEELFKMAEYWLRYHNDMSGRTAEQFINHLLGENKN